LQFLSESYDENCLLPLKEKINSSNVEASKMKVGARALKLSTEAEAVYENLLNTKISFGKNNEMYTQLSNDFAESSNQQGLFRE